MKISTCTLQLGAMGVALFFGSPQLRADDAMEEAAERIEERAEDFADRLDKELDKLVIDGLEEEDDLENLASRFRDRIDDVSDEIDDEDDKEGLREFQQTLTLASQLNKALYDYAFSPALRDMWSEIRTELNALADHYGYVTIVVLHPTQ